MRLRNYFEKGKIEVGCDEAGRGCLAGPVFAAAVILDPKKRNTGINDSKQLSQTKREKQREWIEKNAIAWAVASVSAKEIDEINILNASFLAMERAIKQLNVPFSHALIDGNRFNAIEGVEHHCIIKGDAKFKCIAAASILAKTYRDEYMQKLTHDFPVYDWANNQGYPTKTHRLALNTHGKSVHHRNSFRLFYKDL